MNEKKIWEILKALVEFDEKIIESEQKIRTAAQTIAEKAAQVDDLEERVEELRHELLEARKNVDRQELQAQALKDQEKTKKKQLAQAGSQKEIDALKKELRQLLDQSNTQETLVIQAWHNADKLENQLKYEQSSYDQKQSSFNEEIKELETAAIDAKKEIEAITEQRNEMTKQLTPEWLQQYERMKNRIKRPVVPAIRSCCSECFYTILPQDLVRLNKGELITCRNCYRLLYHDEEAEKASQEASY